MTILLLEHIGTLIRVKKNKGNNTLVVLSKKHMVHCVVRRENILRWNLENLASQPNF
jgi:hypothetical protein